MKNTDQYKNLQYKARAIVDYVADIADESAAKIAELNKKIESLTNFSAPQPLKPYLWSGLTVWEYPKSFYYSSGDYNKPKIPTKTVEELKELQKQDLVILEENKVIAGANTNSFNLAVDFMKRLGLKQTKSEKISSRSYKTRDVTCGWYSELCNQFSMSTVQDEYRMKGFYTENIQKVEEYRQAAEKAKKELEQAAEKETKQKENTAFIVKTVAKYKLEDKFTSPIPSADDLMDGLLRLDKYLFLAHYMAKNRSDWSDGCSYVEHGLSQFNVESPLDQDIYEEVSAATEDFDDGRIFRDLPTYNYDYLFKLVSERNPELHKDYSKLRELICY